MSILNVNAHPCAWPAGWKRTPSKLRRPSNYRVSFVAARNDIVSQLKLLGAREIIVSTNIQLRRDGLPYAATSEPEDPSVAVYWLEKNTTRVVACDQWTKVRENMRAVDVAVKCLRQLQSSGATQIIEQAFLGFKALPASLQLHRDWRVVFGYGGEWHPETLEWATVVRRHRKLLIQRHPDTTTGSREAFDELQAAYEQAKREFHESPA